MITLNVNSLENAEIFWKELGLENEIALNEKFNHEPQTIAIELDYIDELRDKVVELGLEVSEIVPTVEGKHLFSFVAPEGNWVIVIGEWVEVPYSGELRSEFFENMKSVKVIAPSQVVSLPAGSLVLFGRVTCPWTRRLARQLPEIDAQIYYVNTEDTDISPELQVVRARYEAPTVPTLIKKEENGFLKFNKNKGKLSDFIRN